MAKKKKYRFAVADTVESRTYKIKAKAWKEYTEGLKQLSGKASDKLKDYIIAGHTEEETLAYAHALVTRYGEASSELACQMYDALAEYAGAPVKAATPAATATYGETAKAIRGSQMYTKDATTIASNAGRLVKLASADTMLKNALRDGAEFAWIPSGDTCAFCLMLASNGWRKASEDAIENGHATHIHNNCDCNYVVRFSKDVDVEGYHPEELYDEYINAGDTKWERINALRRQHYAANKDYINAQKRAAYARRRNENQKALADKLLHSEPGEMRPPLEYDLDFRDYKELSITETEREYIGELHKAYSENGYENGIIIYGDGRTESRCNNYPSGVDMSIDDEAGPGVKLYHNHTNRSLPSAGDLGHFSDERIDEIGVVTPKGETYIVRARGGDRPTKKEFEDYVEKVSDEVRDDLKNYPDFYDWDLEERQYMYFMLRTRKIITHYGWELEGGMM